MLNSSFYTRLIQNCSPAVVLEVWTMGGWSFSCLVDWKSGD